MFRCQVSTPVLVLLLSVTAFAAEPELLVRAGTAGDSTYSDLKSFVCDERIDRFAGSIEDARERLIDSVTAALSFENGVEHYTNIRQNEQTLSDLAGLPGAWSEGEFGTLLRQTSQFLRLAPPTFERSDEIDGTAAAVYSFNVSEPDSPWDLAVDSRSYRLAFHSEVWISPIDGRILRVTRRAAGLARATGIASITWTVSLRPVRLSGTEWLLPATAQYEVAYLKKRREWNRISFTNYRHYGSTVALRFDLK